MRPRIGEQGCAFSPIRAGMSLRTWLRIVLLAALFLPARAVAQITGAEYLEPTTRYDHGILGDAVEWGDLRITTTDGAYRLPLPDSEVYEDLAPRLWDVTGDGTPEVVVIHTDIARGARLLVIGLVEGRPQAIAATPHIGQTRRWLAPVGSADLDGDGRIEIALVDRPHLAQTLQIWRMDPTGLSLVTEAKGLTTHRIGDAFFSGGITCDGTGIVTYSGDWRRVIVSTLAGDRLTHRDTGPNRPGAVEALTACGS